MLPIPTLRLTASIGAAEPRRLDDTHDSMGGMAPKEAVVATQSRPYRA
jgi:hypothetical protein